MWTDLPDRQPSTALTNAQVEGDGGQTTTQVRRWRHPSLTRITLGAVGLLTLMIGQNFVAVIVTVAVIAVHMPGHTWVRRSLLALLVGFGLNGAVLTLLAVTSTAWDPPLMLATYLIVGTALPSPSRSPRSSRREHVIDAADGWSLAAATGAFAVFYGPLVGASTGRIMARFSFFTDAATHLQLVQDIRQYGGYINLRPAIEGGLTDYPAAWAGNLAMLMQLMLGEDASIERFMRIAAVFTIGCYAVLVFFAAAVALDVVRAVTGRVHPAGGLIALLCLCLFAIGGSNVLLLEGGFFTQMLATAAILASISLLTGREESGTRLLLALCPLTVAVMQTWYLLGPVLAAVLLVYAIDARRSWRVLGLAAMPTALLSLYPVLTGPQGSVQINVPGPSPLPLLTGTLCLLLLALMSLAYLLRAPGGGRSQRVAMLAPLVGSLLLLATVVSFQVATAGQVSYYGYKLLYCVFLLGTVAGALASAVAVDVVLRRVRTPAACGHALFAVAVVVLCVVGAASAQHLTGRFLSGSTPNGIDGRALDTLFLRHPNGLPVGTDAWMVGGCSRAADHIATKWAYDLSLSWNADLHQTYLDFARSRDPSDVSMIAERALSRTPAATEVYSSAPCRPDAIARLRAVGDISVHNG